VAFPACVLVFVAMLVHVFRTVVATSPGPAAGAREVGLKG